MCSAICVGIGALLAGCAGGPKEESRVTAVEAKIDGLTCASCVPPLEASLRGKFEKAAAIEVDDETDTATVRFDKGQEFSVPALRRAAADVQMRVVGLRIQACGRVEANGTERWLTAGTNRFLVQSDREIPVLNQPLCLEGNLDSSHEPPTLEVTSFQAQG